jgi:ATP-dependent DNA helicase
LLIREIPGLAEEFVQTLESGGYTSLYPPQEDAIKNGVLEGENLVLATPTASGKTLVAIMAAMRTIAKGGKVVYLAPLRALASEKFAEFRQTFADVKKSPKVGVKVLISTGDYDSSGESLGTGDIIVLTNERFDSILRHGATWIDQIALFIADEVHLVGEAHRGPTLEMILAKVIRYTPGAQILALSATISNTEELSKWLGAKLVTTEWRPVKLIEGVYDGGTLYFVDEDSRKLTQTNRGGAIDVAMDTVSESGQSLIFCETRKRAVAMAEKAAEIVPTLLSFEDSSELREVATRIRNSGEETDVSRRLANVVERGVAFHHAGLDSKHRQVIEEAFKKRQIKILTATPTLAAGVNLPARRVVLSSVMRYNAEEGGQTPISILEFKQMAGRAGRPLYDKVGEIVLLANQSFNSDELLEHYINGEPEPIRSKLSAEGPLRAALLGLIAAQSGIRESEVYDFFESTLFGSQFKEITIRSRVKKALEFLREEELILARTKRFLATKFGKRVAMLYIDPQSATIMRRAIRYAEKGKKHTLGLMHVIVQTPDMSPKFETRQKDSKEVDEILSNRESEFVTPIPASGDQSFYSEYDDLLGDFRTVLALNAWINENPEQFLLEKYSIEPGDLHRMVENANWLLYSLGELSRLFGRLDLALECEELRERVRYGIKPELMMLTRLEGIGRVRARSLFNAGFTTIEKLSEAPVERLASVPKIGNAVAAQIKQQLH